MPGRNVSYNISRSVIDSQARYILLNVKLKGTETYLININVKNKDDPKVYDKLFVRVENLPTRQSLMNGDFNILFDDNHYKIGRKVGSQ